jgi:hydroxyacylglutathione hydrolase
LGKPTEHLGVLSVNTLKDMLEQNKIILIDVREEREWEEEHIKGSLNIYVGHLKQDVDRLPKDKPIATTCEWGGRGGLAASILKNMGFSNVYNVLGGLRSWRNLRYPVISG